MMIAKQGGMGKGYGTQFLKILKTLFFRKELEKIVEKMYDVEAGKRIIRRY
jgi:hypothetical protein